MSLRSTQKEKTNTDHNNKEFGLEPYYLLLVSSANPLNAPKV